MSDTSSKPQATAIDRETIAEALDKNQQATESIKDATEELAVVHAVLDKQVNALATATQDVSAAVDRANEIEKRLTESAQTLDEVNELLSAQVNSTASK